MSNKSRNLIAAETNLIRKYLDQRLELGKSHEDIMQELQISQATYYRYVKRIMEQDAQAWDKQYLDSAKYRAVQLLTDLQNYRNLCLKIAMDEKERSTDRIEAYKTAAEASANIFKLVQDGPIFKVTVKSSQLPFDINNQQYSIKDNNSKQLPN